MSWRLFSDDGVAAGAGLACDEILARRVGCGESPPTLRLYTYRPHAALVGRFQDADRELRLDECARLGVEVNRRPTGGGAILMGPDQLGVALAVQGRGPFAQGRARYLMARFSDGLTRALQRLGVAAKFRGKNDLEVRGRKIAGLGLYRDPSGGLLFHASLLADLDVELMASVLVTPFEQTDADLARLARRTTTLREQLGRSIALEDVRPLVAEGFAGSFNERFERAPLVESEEAAIGLLTRDKYGTQAWVHQRTAVPDTAGVGSLATPGGRVDVRVALAGRTLKAVALRGDFFATEEAVADLEGRLRWHSSEASAVTATVANWARECGDGTLPTESIACAVIAAAQDARGAAVPAGDRSLSPYGCFVDPGAES